MKFALIGPGILSIPPPGWGAVEILIWDYYNELTKKVMMLKLLIKCVQIIMINQIHLHNIVRI